MMVGKSSFLKLGTRVVTVLVGEGEAQREFVVHENLICGHSNFFREEMSGKRNLSVIAWPDEVPTIAEAYIHALYARNVQIACDDNNYKDRHLIWGRLFVLAETLQGAKTKNLIIKHWQTQGSPYENTVEFLKMAEIVYNGTPKYSPARRFLVDMLVRHNSNHIEDVKSVAERYQAMEIGNSELLKDLVWGLMTGRRIHRGKVSVEEYLEAIEGVAK